MSTGVSGDFAALARARNQMLRMKGVPEKVVPRVAPQFMKLTDGGFSSSTDPYGNAWRPLKMRTIRLKGFSTPLVHTGAMRAALDVAPGGRQLTILLGTSYARFHISTGRGILPLRGKFPETWRTILNREIPVAFREVLEGR